MTPGNRPKPLVLVILDGWGLSDRHDANAIALAHPEFYQTLLHDYPATTLEVSGEAVGLPEGQMGNSEVGHLNIGAGRIVYQELTRINKAIRDRELARNPVLLEALHAVGDRTLHLIGLLSDGGVHSHIAHLFALIDAARARGVRRIRIHALLDGRDTPPKSGIEYVQQLERFLDGLGSDRPQIATVCGRYYAMDRDNRWDRVQKAYAALVLGSGAPARSAEDAVRESYAAGRTDEFMLPAVITAAAGDPLGKVQDDDALLFFNFRADRARELSRAFLQDSFDGFPRLVCPRLARFVTLTSYDPGLKAQVLFAPNSLSNIFGALLSQNGMRQLRIAETEKYAHVTYFFNGGVEQPFEGEDRVLIPSPKDVATYDEKPQMSANEVTAAVVSRIQSGQYDVVILNFANPDMIGHTGVLPAAVAAVKVIDGCLQRIVAATERVGGSVIITADHGNLEQMVDEKGQPHTAHTTNPVPLILVNHRKLPLRPNGIHADIAPTMLELLGLPQPDEMTGRSLIQH